MTLYYHSKVDNELQLYFHQNEWSEKRYYKKYSITSLLHSEKSPNPAPTLKKKLFSNVTLT